MASDLAASNAPIDDHGYGTQIEAAVNELLALERDPAWKYHSVKQNVLISQMHGSPLASSAPFSRIHGGYLADDRRKEFQMIRGQGIVHATPEIAFNCISDLDTYAMWDGTSSEQQLIAEYSMGEEGLVRILYIRFNGIFPVSSRDICVCTIKRPLVTRKQKQMSSKYATSPHNRKATQTSDSDGESFALIAFSVDHPSCPPTPGYIRAELRASGFIIRPHTNSACAEVTYLLQFNAKGWLPSALSSMVSEYQPLRIAKIRDIARTYHENDKDASKVSLTDSSSSIPIRFSWMQQCRGALKEEEEFLALEKQRLEHAIVEAPKANSNFLRSRPSSSTNLATSSSSMLHVAPPSSKHYRSASYDSPKRIRRLSYGSGETDGSNDSSPKRYRVDGLNDGVFTTEGEGGESEVVEGRSRPRSHLAMRLRRSSEVESSTGEDRDSEEESTEVESSDSEPFYDATSELSLGALIEPGSNNYVTVLRMLNNDVEHIKGVQMASQERLEAIEENLKRRTVENTRLLSHLEGLKSFLLACKEKLKVYTSEHKAMESMRMRMENKWHTKLASIAQKLSAAQKGYWNSKRARRAAMYRYSTLLFLIAVWPLIFIKLYSILQQPAKHFRKFIKAVTFVADWLFPHIPFNSDT